MPYSKSSSYFANNNESERLSNKLKLENYKRSYQNFHKLFKKSNINKQKENLSQWQSIKIEDLVHKNKLNSKDPNTILYKGELYKYATPKSNSSNQICYRKFFVLERKFLR